MKTLNAELKAYIQSEPTYGETCCCCFEDHGSTMRPLIKMSQDFANELHRRFHRFPLDTEAENTVGVIVQQWCEHADKCVEELRKGEDYRLHRGCRYMPTLECRLMSCTSLLAVTGLFAVVTIGVLAAKYSVFLWHEV